jgi:septal ring factor EnvC (AmiA/AmiB activator)
MKDALFTIEKEQDSFSEKPPGGFASCRGRLPLPIEGQILARENWPFSPEAGSHAGVFIESAGAAEVRAVFPGTIAFSGVLKGYGNVVILDHGERFYTISAHLSEMVGDVGDFVAVGGIVGRVHEFGMPPKGIAYFEIREAGTGLEPRAWFGIR